MPYSKLFRDLILSGAIGDVANVQHLEPIGFWHFAHSYVRGNWRKEDEVGCPSVARHVCVHEVGWVTLLTALLSVTWRGRAHSC